MDPITLLVMLGVGLATSLLSAELSITANKEQQERSFDFTAKENELSREFTAEEAQKSRDFEEYMSSTAMQRQVADYKAAGINLGAIGGSNATSGATATGLSSPMASAGTSGLSNIMNTAGLNNNLNGYLNKIMESSAKQTLQANAKEFGDFVETNAKNFDKEFREYKSQKEFNEWLKTHPGMTYDDFLDDF